MRYIYLDNFRGFKRTVIPVDQVNFLVGENSTGKSSLLRLISIVSHHMFTWDPTFAFDQSTDQGTFDDLVSVSTSDRSYFEIGYYEDGTTEQEQAVIYRFGSHDGMPRIEWIISAHDGHIAQASFTHGEPKVRSAKAHSQLFTEGGEAVIHRLLRWAQEDKPQFSKAPRDVPPAMLMSLAVSEKLRSKFSPVMQRPFIGSPVTWIAPIRSAPQQFYGGAKAVYTPDGQHAPYVLRQTLQRGTSERFVEYLQNFGEASGLFDTIVTHSFGDDPRSPFELLVKFHNVELSINNVGYGVSQVLPLIVEFLTNPPGSFFLIQQPEVHLHPRAQAALGALMYQLAKERDYTYFAETHSDFLIDRYRLTMHRDTSGGSPKSQVLFFTRGESGNIAHPITIEENGRFSKGQPKEFREFFIREEMSLLEI